LRHAAAPRAGHAVMAGSCSGVIPMIRRWRSVSSSRLSRTPFRLRSPTSRLSGAGIFFARPTSLGIGSRRARAADASDRVHPGGTLITRVGTDVRWWTWAGYRANATRAATLPSVADPVQRPTGAYVGLREELTPEMWHTARSGAENALTLPDVDPRAVRGLKFSAALPERVAIATVATRLADFDGAEASPKEPARLQLGGAGLLIGCEPSPPPVFRRGAAVLRVCSSGVTCGQPVWSTCL
jgi:hypothetical protein